MKYKKVLCGFVTTLLVGLFIVPVMAGESFSLTKDGLYSVSVCSTPTLSSHSINSRNGNTYPFGKAYVYTSISGVPQGKKEIYGQSQATYWTAGYCVQTKYEEITSATTIGYGTNVTASSR